jgi:hypothetical protein
VTTRRKETSPETTYSLSSSALPCREELIPINQVKSRLSELQSIEECQEVMQALKQRMNVLGFEEPCALEKISSLIPELDSVTAILGQRVTLLNARFNFRSFCASFESRPNVFNNLRHFLPRIADSVKACRVVEVSAKKQSNSLIAQGHKSELRVSLTVKVDRKERLVFFENWAGGCRSIGETLPADYDISNKMVSRKAQSRIDELARLTN